VNRLAALVAAAILLGMACFSWRERRSTEQGYLWLTGSKGRNTRSPSSIHFQPWVVLPNDHLVSRWSDDARVGNHDVAIGYPRAEQWSCHA
jgi:hypothetical protein